MADASGAGPSGAGPSGATAPAQQPGGSRKSLAAPVPTALLPPGMVPEACSRELNVETASRALKSRLMAARRAAQSETAAPANAKGNTTKAGDGKEVDANRGIDLSARKNGKEYAVLSRYYMPPSSSAALNVQYVPPHLLRLVWPQPVVALAVVPTSADLASGDSGRGGVRGRSLANIVDAKLREKADGLLSEWADADRFVRGLDADALAALRELFGSGRTVESQLNLRPDTPPPDSPPPDSPPPSPKGGPGGGGKAPATKKRLAKSDKQLRAQKELMREARDEDEDEDVWEPEKRVLSQQEKDDNMFTESERRRLSPEERRRILEEIDSEFERLDRILEDSKEQLDRIALFDAQKKSAALFAETERLRRTATRFKNAKRQKERIANREMTNEERAAYEAQLAELQAMYSKASKEFDASDAKLAQRIVEVGDVEMRELRLTLQRDPIAKQRTGAVEVVLFGHPGFAGKLDEGRVTDEQMDEPLYDVTNPRVGATTSLGRTWWGLYTNGYLSSHRTLGPTAWAERLDPRNTGTGNFPWVWFGLRFVRPAEAPEPLRRLENIASNQLTPVDVLSQLWRRRRALENERDAKLFLAQARRARSADERGAIEQEYKKELQAASDAIEKAHKNRLDSVRALVNTLVAAQEGQQSKLREVLEDAGADGSAPIRIKKSVVAEVQRALDDLDRIRNQQPVALGGASGGGAAGPSALSEGAAAATLREFGLGADSRDGELRLSALLEGAAAPAAPPAHETLRAELAGLELLRSNLDAAGATLVYNFALRMLAREHPDAYANDGVPKPAEVPVLRSADVEYRLRRREGALIPGDRQWQLPDSVLTHWRLPRPPETSVVFRLETEGIDPPDAVRAGYWRRGPTRLQFLLRQRSADAVNPRERPQSLAARVLVLDLSGEAPRSLAALLVRLEDLASPDALGAGAWTLFVVTVDTTAVRKVALVLEDLNAADLIVGPVTVSFAVAQAAPAEGADAAAWRAWQRAKFKEADCARRVALMRADLGEPSMATGEERERLLLLGATPEEERRLRAEGAGVDALQRAAENRVARAVFEHLEGGWSAEEAEKLVVMALQRSLVDRVVAARLLRMAQRSATNETLPDVRANADAWRPRAGELPSNDAALTAATVRHMAAFETATGGETLMQALRDVLESHREGRFGVDRSFVALAAVRDKAAGPKTVYAAQERPNTVYAAQELATGLGILAPDPKDAVRGRRTQEEMMDLGALLLSSEAPASASGNALDGIARLLLEDDGARMARGVAAAEPPTGAGSSAGAELSVGAFLALNVFDAEEELWGTERMRNPQAAQLRILLAKFGHGGDYDIAQVDITLPQLQALWKAVFCISVPKTLLPAVPRDQYAFIDFDALDQYPLDWHKRLSARKQLFLEKLDRLIRDEMQNTGKFKDWQTAAKKQCRAGSPPDPIDMLKSLRGLEKLPPDAPTAEELAAQASKRARAEAQERKRKHEAMERAQALARESEANKRLRDSEHTG
jgi:hypothetical protein